MFLLNREKRWREIIRNGFAEQHEVGGSNVAQVVVVFWTVWFQVV
jgi:hypothetical protein